MSRTTDLEAGMRALAAQVTQQAADLKAAEECIAELAAAVRGLQDAQGPGLGRSVQAAAAAYARLGEER